MPSTGTRAARRANAAREPAPERRRAARHSDRVAQFALGRHRPHDRPRRGGRTVGPLQARRAQRVHPQALHDAGPEGVRRNPQASTAPTANSSRPSTATSPSSSGCSTRSRATTAARWWRAPTSPRKPARSTPCWRTRPAASTELLRTGNTKRARHVRARFVFARAVARYHGRIRRAPTAM